MGRPKPNDFFSFLVEGKNILVANVYGGPLLKGCSAPLIVLSNSMVSFSPPVPFSKFFTGLDIHEFHCEISQLGSRASIPSLLSRAFFQFIVWLICCLPPTLTAQGLSNLINKIGNKIVRPSNSLIYLILG